MESGLRSVKKATLARSASDGIGVFSVSRLRFGLVAVAAETANLVAAAVSQLPPRQRMVVVLRNWNWRGSKCSTLPETG